MSQWKIDMAHSAADFVVRHMMVTNVRGTFGELYGNINFDPANPAAASVEATIKVASITTGVEDRDNHLRSPDFFEVEKYANIMFKSTAVEIVADNKAKVTGDLTIRDVTKRVTLDVQFFGESPSPYGDIRAGFEANTSINREDFGLTWNQTLETGGVLVGKEVRIHLDIQGVKVAEQVTA